MLVDLRGPGSASPGASDHVLTTSSPLPPPANSINDEGHFSLVRNFRLADCVTIMNGVCGSLSVFNSGKYLLTSNINYLWWASHPFCPESAPQSLALTSRRMSTGSRYGLHLLGCSLTLSMARSPGGGTRAVCSDRSSTVWRIRYAISMLS